MNSVLLLVNLIIVVTAEPIHNELNKHVNNQLIEKTADLKDSEVDCSGLFVCPVNDLAKTGCKEPTDCLYPNPTNCDTYIECIVNADNRTATPVVMPCYGALEWNDNKKLCDYPEQSTCSNSVSRGAWSKFLNFFGLN